jgi:signal transduction histidine kinase
MVLSVQDDGPGMSAKDRRMALAPLAHHNVLQRRSEKPGLGLAIVQAFIDRHGGRMDIDSGPEGGTVVSLHFPPERLA